jgi:hypothetical protein
MAVTDIQWMRVLVGGFLIEITLFAVVLPLNALSSQVTYYSVPFLVFASGIIFGYWVARPLKAAFVLHGALVAVVASVIYVSLTTALAAPVPLLFHLSHGLRVLGGMLGGKLAQRRVVPDVETISN